jgi:hypothetical protein
MAGSSVKTRKMSVKTLWMSWPPPKRKKQTAHGVRAMDVGALTILGTFARIRPEEDGGGESGSTRT